MSNWDWISVKEMVPDDYRLVYVTTEFCVLIGRYGKGQWKTHNHGFIRAKVMGWREIEIPDVPERFRCYTIEVK